MTTPPIMQGPPVSGQGLRPGPAYAVFITVFLITMIIATAVTFILPETYASTARVEVVAAPSYNDSYGGYFPQVEFEIIQSQLVLSNVVKKLDLNDAWGKKYFGGETLKTAESMQILKQRLNVAPAPDTRHIAITVYSDDRREAAAIANTVAVAYQDFYLERQKAEAGKAAATTVTILDTAVPADRPCKPNKPLNLALGAVARVVLGEMTRAAAAARRAADDHIGEMAAGWVGPNYLLSLREELAARPDGPERFKLLRQATGDAMALQRGDTWSAQVQIERDKLKFRRQQHRDKLKAEKAAKRAEAKAATQWRDPNAPMTDAELKACVDKVDEIMGLK